MHPFKTTLKINAKSAEMFNFALINENMNNQIAFSAESSVWQSFFKVKDLKI